MSAVEEHLATRRAAGLFDFSFMGLYEFRGKPALQALQTRDLDALAPGQIAYTLLLKEDGAVAIDATVWRRDDDRFWLFTGKRARYDARDRSGEHAVLALQGPASGRILAGLIGADAVRALRYFHFMARDKMIVARLGYSGELGYELLVPAARAAALRQALLERAVPECSFAAADSLRIESGYVLFDREIDGQANPEELGLERLVVPSRKFTVKKRLAGLEIQEEPLNKDLPQAVLTSECLSPTLEKRIGLGFVPPEARGEARLADGRGARIVPLPFYDPGRRRPRGAPI